MDLSHIPVIFLTAKNDIDSKINGLKIGAEAFVLQPMQFQQYLLLQVLPPPPPVIRRNQEFSLHKYHGLEDKYP